MSKYEEEDKVFDELYEKYSNTIHNWSGGLTETNKTEFLKLYAFYNSVIYPDMMKFWEAYLGKKIN